MTAPIRPSRPEGLRTLAPEIARIVDALARVVEERDYHARPQAAPLDPQEVFEDAQQRFPTILNRLAE